MSSEDKIREGAQQFLEAGEQVLAAFVARPRGWTQQMAGSMALGGNQQAKAHAGANQANFALASPMALAITQSETIDPHSFTVRPTDGHVLLTLRREAQTLWLYRVGPLKKYLTQSALGEGGPAS